MRHLKKISRHGDLATGIYAKEIQTHFLTTSASVADMNLYDPVFLEKKEGQAPLQCSISATTE
jgi:hypothetical protein